MLDIPEVHHYSAGAALNAEKRRRVGEYVPSYPATLTATSLWRVIPFDMNAFPGPALMGHQAAGRRSADTCQEPKSGSLTCGLPIIAFDGFHPTTAASYERW